MRAYILKKKKICSPFSYCRFVKLMQNKYKYQVGTLTNIYFNFSLSLQIMRHAIETEHEPDSKWSLSLSLSVDPSAYRVINSYNLKRLAR